MADFTAAQHIHDIGSITNFMQSGKNLQDFLFFKMDFENTMYVGIDVGAFIDKLLLNF